MNKLVTLVAAAVVLSTTYSHAQVAAPKFGGNGGAEISVVCPTKEGDAPMFKSGATTYPIFEPHLRAVAAKACEPNPLQDSPASTVPVSVTNSRSSTLYVSFTSSNGAPGPITWAANGNCTVSGSSVAIAAWQTCSAIVPAAAGSTRFCAAHGAAPANCYLGQANHQTLVETTFVPYNVCFPAGQPCVYYDISLIPTNCTDGDWAADQCAGTGGSAYNLPVSVGCDGITTFACMGPTDSTWGSEQYPSNCGNPNGTCVGGGKSSCVQAYFFPMFSGVPATHQPTGGCFKNKVFAVTWLSGS